MKNLAFTFLIAMFASVAFAQKPQYQLSSHILDITKGMPAAGVNIKLEKYTEQNKTWSFVAEKITDKAGRIPDFLPSDKSNLGIYRLTYFTAPYFKKNHEESFYPFIEVVFQIKDGQHYHVPITLSAFGYSTYRGN
ncbi:5-hydroxyisourate hydrolase [Pedobacter sp. UYP30]|uniref:hydroxyisourate hydrolase n=1 Tax=Pedobacter sp. UYP30 TaxID=1756400 RepID=UPI0033968143